MYRQGVSIILLNKQKEILLENLVSFATYYYALPGGGKKPSEKLEKTVVRELKEELGISKNLLTIVNHAAKPIRFTFKDSPLVRDGITYLGQERLYFFVNFKGTDSDITINIKEVRKYVWSKYNDLYRYLLFKGQLEDTIKMISELYPKIT